MTIQERKKEITRINSSAMKPADKILALQDFVKQEKKADEEEKKKQEKAIADQAKEEKVEATQQAKLDAQEKSDATTKKIELTNLIEIAPKLEEIKTTLENLQPTDLTETNALLTQLIKVLEQPCHVNLTLE